MLARLMIAVEKTLSHSKRVGKRGREHLVLARVCMPRDAMAREEVGLGFSWPEELTQPGSAKNVA